MDTCISVAESLHCPPEIVTTLFSGYTPIQNKKFKKTQYLQSAKKRKKEASLCCFSTAHLKLATLEIIPVGVIDRPCFSLLKASDPQSTLFQSVVKPNDYS